MRALDVDLRSRLVPPRWAWLLEATALAVAIGALGALAWKFRQLEELRAQRDRLQQELAVSVETPQPVIRNMPYDASAREMLAQATSKWPAMLEALESTKVMDVVPVAIEIAPAERWIRVEIKFSEYPQLLNYADELNVGFKRPQWGLVQAQGVAAKATGAITSTASLLGTW